MLACEAVLQLRPTGDYTRAPAARGDHSRQGNACGVRLDGAGRIGDCLEQRQSVLLGDLIENGRKFGEVELDKLALIDAERLHLLLRQRQIGGEVRQELVFRHLPGNKE